MDMIKTFLEIEVNDDGELIPKQDRQNYMLFAKQKLLISRHTEFVNEHLGQYPVISVSFKDVKGSNYQDIFNKTKFAINRTFKQHGYMINVLNKMSEVSATVLDKKKATDSLDTFFKIYLKHGQEANKEEIEDSLKFLSELLYNHFKKKVYVLIDEYDAPLDSIMRSSLGVNDLSSTNFFIDLLLGAVLKDNDTYLEKGLMTGISGIAKNSSSSKLNNVTAYRFLDNHIYGKYYGFNNNEIPNLINQDELDDVTRYYNGYRIIKQGLQIYNPWSIMKYIQTGIINNYWCQSGPIEHIQDLFKYTKVREKLNLLIKDNGISFQFNNTPKIQDIQNLRNVLNCSVKEIPESHINLFFSYIFEHGYLTPVEITDQPKSTFMNNYKIPNQEIEQEFAQSAINYYIDSYALKKNNVDSTIAELKYIINNYDKLESDAIEKLSSAIQTLCQNLEFTKISTCEDSSHPNESVLHTIVGWIIIQSNAKNFGSEVPINSGMQSGKPDIVATYKELGIIIELKYKKTAEEALKQIKEKCNNNIFLKLPYIKKILNMGINLDENKEVTIKYQKVYNNKKVTTEYDMITISLNNNNEVTI